jgi:CubicO group peptidase (beta-lactamase class C family)
MMKTGHFCPRTRRLRVLLPVAVVVAASALLAARSDTDSSGLEPAERIHAPGSTRRGPIEGDSLVGLWGAERSFGPEVRGVLTIDGRAEPWWAEISGYRVRVERMMDTVAFELPGGRGILRARLVEADGGREAIAGHWIQPPPLTRGVPYATPVRLSAVQPGVWRGRVEPIEDRLSIYLIVQRDSADELRAFIRNPELNLGVWRTFDVSVTDDRVQFINVRDSTDRLEGRVDPAVRRLSLVLPPIGTTFDLTRRDSADAPGFYPRTPPSGRYVHRRPPPADDGWETASLGDVGIDPRGVDSLVQTILNQPTESYTSPYIHSLLVARHGKLVVEEYFYGFSRERTHDTRSAGKTFAPLLVGLTQEHGNGPAPTATLDALLPEYQPFGRPDTRKGAITVGDLMSMTSGLACDDNDDASPGMEDRMQSQTDEPDWYRYTLDLPMASTPGSATAVYCTAGINLLGALVRDATGSWVPDFFQRYVAEPLQFQGYHMNLMPTGEAYLGGGIFLRPRDMLKLGQLYLDGGTWQGRRIVDRSWVERSVIEHSRFDPDHGYGFGWHLHTFDVRGKRYREYAAEGNGGQFVMVFPDVDMVVVVTGGNYGNFPTWNRFQDRVARHLLPAVTGDGS